MQEKNPDSEFSFGIASWENLNSGLNWLFLYNFRLLLIGVCLLGLLCFAFDGIT
jgi:hypothetical protein